MSERPGDRPEQAEPPSEDELWRAIVANYGERPSLASEPVAEHSDEDLETRPEEDSEADSDVDHPYDQARDVGEDELELVDPADHFVPPPPPPLPRVEGPRLLAWIGVFLVPLLLLVNSVAQIDVPSWVVLLLMCWFVGGFAYLVATMSQGPPPGEFDGDDGARL